MSTPEPVRCQNCRYFADTFAPNAAIVTPDGFGECRRRAPTGPWSYGQLEVCDGKQRQIQSVQSAFPLTSEDDWCGEFIGIDGYLFVSPRDLPTEEF